MIFNGPQPEQLEKVSTGSYIAGMLPYIRTEIESMSKDAMNRVFAALRRGDYTTQLGDDTWRELLAYKRILSRFETLISLGQSAGADVADQMKIGDTDG